MPGLVSLPFRVDMLAGGVFSLGGIEDIGLPAYAEMLTGGLFAGPIGDIGLPFYADAMAGGIVATSATIDDGQFQQVDIYSDMLFGGLFTMRMLAAEVPPNPIFLFDSQAQPSGSKLGQGQASGAIE